MNLSTPELVSLIVSYSLATLRLFNVARPLWSRGPEWLQAFVIALISVLPQFASAVGLAETKLDVALAALLALGAMGTAMKRAPALGAAVLFLLISTAPG